MQRLAQQQRCPHQRQLRHPRKAVPTVSDELLKPPEHRLPPSPSSRTGCNRPRKRRRRHCSSAWSCSGAPPTRRSELAAIPSAHLVIIDWEQSVHYRRPQPSTHSADHARRSLLCSMLLLVRVKCLFCGRCVSHYMRCAQVCRPASGDQAAAGRRREDADGRPRRRRRRLPAAPAAPAQQRGGTHPSVVCAHAVQPGHRSEAGLPVSIATLAAKVETASCYPKDI